MCVYYSITRITAVLLSTQKKTSSKGQVFFKQCPMAGTAQGPWAAQGQARRCFYARARACVHMRGHTCVQLAPSAPRLAVLGAACLRRWREAALRLGAARGSSFLWRAAQRGGIGGTASDVQLGQNVCDLLGLRLAGPMSGRAPPPTLQTPLFFHGRQRGRSTIQGWTGDE